MDARGNVYFQEERVERSLDGTIRTRFFLTSLDRAGRVRFRVLAGVGNNVSPGRMSELALINDQVMVVESWSTDYDGTTAAIVLSAFRAEDGVETWSRDLRGDAVQFAGSRPLFTASAGPPSRGTGYVAVPLSLMLEPWPGQLEREPRGVVAAYDPRTGVLLGHFDALGGFPGTMPWGDPEALALDETGNIYVPFPASTLGGHDARLYELDPGGTIRLLLPAVPLGVTAVASGTLVLSSDTQRNATGSVQVRRTGHGELLVDSGVHLFAPLISGNQFSFVECGWGAFTCQLAALVTYSLVPGVAPWKVELGRTPAGSIDVRDPVITSSGSVLLLELVHVTQDPPSGVALLRELDVGGHEIASCSLPGQGLHGSLNLAGGRLVIRSDDRLLVFDAAGRVPAPHGWVTTRASPERDGRAR